MTLLRQFPLFVILLLIASGLMLIPCLHAIRLEDWETARTFFYHGVFFCIISFILGLATMNRQPRINERYQLLTLLLAYILLPVPMSLPIAYLAPAITGFEAYFEMLSSLTTTGATVFNDPQDASEPLHLWRATIAWMGGFLILLAGFSILAPMKLGGFEIETTLRATSDTQRRLVGGAADSNARLLRQAGMIAPPYVILTAVLTILLMLAGDRSLVALCHAMSVLSTSGISPLSDLSGAASGYKGEMLIAVFLLFAITHKGFTLPLSLSSLSVLFRNPEMRLAMLCMLIIPTLLFARHFAGAFDIEGQSDALAALKAFWGGIFTVLSFLTTTGFQSLEWQTAGVWSGLQTPGLVLLGLAIMGGGVATTAGGVKLLRIYALYKHGRREMDRLVYPNSVGGAGVTARRIRREGAYVAWIFLMLFILGVSLTMLALSLFGLDFQQSAGLAVAALTNTGPAANMLDPTLTYAQLDTGVLAILSLAMVVGRLEVLVVIALFNPDYWRQ